ncbi:MAG TPA: hypothetical protein VFG51_02460 [Candidatus Saccharimonadia bacterium]|nr:hypothetical protein [Candidatus Saccharimonadia bacterium]
MRDNGAQACGAPRRMLHVDINAYFATMLQQENPFLRGRPVGVVKSEGRTCVIASSKEAKKLGVKTGCRVPEARALAPNIVLVPANFQMCLDATHRLRNIFAEIAPSYEIFSLDEAFIDLTDCARIYPDPHIVGRHIQSQIKKKLGEWVTCNVGISYNKLLAKLTSEMSPKGSVTEITRDNLDDMLMSAKFSEVCGIGYRLQKKLNAIGVTNPYMINFVSDEDLLRQFGPYWAPELRRIGRGEDSALLAREDTNPYMKSVGRSITGFKLCDDENTIRSVLYNLMEEVTYKVRKMNMAGRYISIGLYGHDDAWWSHRTLKFYVRHTSDMFELLYTELYKSWKRRFKVIKYSVMLSMLKPMGEVPIPLIGNWEKQDKIYRAIDRITDKYGLFKVRSGVMLNVPVIRPEVTGYLGDKKFYGLG